MANGRIRFGKQSGGELALVTPDGVDNTEVVFPESGVLATKEYVRGIPSGFKNYIINGKKGINQRGTTDADNSYNQDRWYKAGNNWFQGIEGDNNLIDGKTYTLSWEGSATAGYYVGDASSSTINTQTFIPIENGGSFTLTISAGQNLWVKFESDATGSTFNFVQLEEGSVATSFENRPIGLELSLCYRYYEESVGTIYWSGYVVSGTIYSTVSLYKSEKRVSPTVELELYAAENMGPGTLALNDEWYWDSKEGVGVKIKANSTANRGSLFAGYKADAEL